MSQPIHDVTLTGEERRQLASLAERSGADLGGRRIIVHAKLRLASVRSRRFAATGEMLLLLLGLTTMLVTFATWPLVSLLGVGLTTVGLAAVCVRHSDRSKTALRRWVASVSAQRQ